MKYILRLIVTLLSLVKRFRIKYINRPLYKSCLGYCGKNVDLRLDKNPGALSRVYMYDNTNIYHGFRFISVTGKFILKKNSGSAAGLTVITGNHQRKNKYLFKTLSKTHELDIEKDIIVEEDVWIGANVTLLAGVKIGRGATVAAGSVCIKSIPPYAVVMGNPAKVIGFNYTPEEVIEHEKVLYPEEERISLETMQKNYEKYFISRINDIKQFTKL